MKDQLRHVPETVTNAKTARILLFVQLLISIENEPRVVIFIARWVVSTEATKNLIPDRLVPQN